MTHFHSYRSLAATRIQHQATVHTKGFVIFFDRSLRGLGWKLLYRRVIIYTTAGGEDLRARASGRDGKV